jgi:hypothetical protein
MKKIERREEEGRARERERATDERESDFFFYTEVKNKLNKK